MTTLPLPLVPTLRTPDGATITFTSSDINFDYPILKLNTGDAGPGVTQPPQASGIYIQRGSAPSAQFVWQESIDKFQAGLDGQLKNVGLVQPATGNGFLRWNGSYFVDTNNQYVNLVDQDVSAGSTPNFTGITTNSHVINFPTTAALSGQTFINDGAGNLYWGAGGGGGGASDYIQNLGGTTKVSTTDVSNEVTIKANNNIIGRLDDNQILFNRSTLINNSINFKSTSFTSNSYTTQNSDTLIVYNGTGNSTASLPTVVSNQSRWIIYENLSSSILTVQPSGGNTIDGSVTSLSLDPQGTVVMLSDGINNWITI